MKKKYIIGIWVFILTLTIISTFTSYGFLANMSTVIIWMALFTLADLIFNLEFKIVHYILALCIFITGFSFSYFYHRYFYYDKILHIVSPFFGSFIIFFLIDKLEIKFRIKILLTFTILISIITGIEIYEYLSDMYLSTLLQGVYLKGKGMVQNRINDSMIDLILGFISSLLFSFFKIFLNGERLKN